MRILVTGGSGFIGRYVVDELLSRGHDPLVFDHHGSRHVRGGTSGKTDVFLGSITDPVAVTEAAAHVDGIIHLAGVLGTRETIDNPRPAAETNVLGGLNVLEAATQYDLPMVYIAVGNHWMENTYSITKTVIERFCRMFRDERGLRVSTVRAMNAYGPDQLAAAPFGPGKVRKIMPAFVCRALTGENVEIYGDGSQIMDMVYVADVAWGLVTAFELTEQNGPLPSEVTLGTGRSTTVREIAEVVIQEAATESGRDPVGITRLPMRPGEPERSTVLADISTLAMIGLSPVKLVSLEDGVARTVRWFNQARGLTWDAPRR